MLANDHKDTCEIEARLSGRDGDAEQMKALRRFNGHLHRIEVITFDQLVRIVQRVLSYIESALRPLLPEEQRPEQADA